MFADALARAVAKIASAAGSMATPHRRRAKCDRKLSTGDAYIVTKYKGSLKSDS